MKVRAAIPLHDKKVSMPLTIRLLGRPSLEREGVNEAYRFRSRKSWALLAYLILSEHPTARSTLSGLLFAEANDPLRALRWCLTEIRRGLDRDGVVDGDPVILQLGDRVIVDAKVILTGGWPAVIAMADDSSGLLDGMAIRGAPAFESWLLATQHQVATAKAQALHGAAMTAMNNGAIEEALRYAAACAVISPLDQEHHALLIKLYRLSGDHVAADRQFDAIASLLSQELGESPGTAILAALQH